MSTSTLEVLFEAHAKQDADNFALLRSEMAEMRRALGSDVAKMHDEVVEIKQTIARNKGFVGGVVFVVSALFAVIVAVISNWK